MCIFIHFKIFIKKMMLKISNDPSNHFNLQLIYVRYIYILQFISLYIIYLYFYYRF
jgi:hypothetical protein